jgi:hypothetical protein
MSESKLPPKTVIRKVPIAKDDPLIIVTGKQFLNDTIDSYHYYLKCLFESDDPKQKDFAKTQLNQLEEEINQKIKILTDLKDKIEREEI